MEKTNEDQQEFCDGCFLAWLETEIALLDIGLEQNFITMDEYLNAFESLGVEYRKYLGFDDEDDSADG